MGVLFAEIFHYVKDHTVDAGATNNTPATVELDKPAPAESGAQKKECGC